MSPEEEELKSTIEDLMKICQNKDKEIAKLKAKVVKLKNRLKASQEQGKQLTLLNEILMKKSPENSLP